MGMLGSILNMTPQAGSQMKNASINEAFLTVKSSRA
jgi:hypothetical protein